ncbi:MAG: pyrroline-5-carboxylate reductase [Clostridiales bacterium]|nr:pyrroline-5-carboxylate reductase [Clostridiales bacterium]
MKIGFIGAGNMGSAILNGILKSGFLAADQVAITDKTLDHCAKFAAQGVCVMPDNKSLVQACECVLLAIKPVYTAQVVEEIYEALEDKFVISIVAGWDYDKLDRSLPKSARFVRVMPNTPLAVGEGMSLISEKCRCREEEFEFTYAVFAAAGKVAKVEDHVFVAATSINGCGPAFVYQFIEALADGGVRYGVPRVMAYELAAQTLIGAAKMVLETGEHPGKLKDAVCSPGGTTIEGIYALEKGGMRAAVMDALGATIEKTLKISK